MTIEPRAEWGGPADPLGHPMVGAKPLVIIHHSYKPNLTKDAAVKSERAAIKGMHDYHKAQEWGGLSYQFCAFQSGRAYEGRGWGRTGAHTVGRNSSSVAIVLVMDGETYEPTPALIATVRAIIADGVRSGHIHPQHEIAPHDQFKNKVCPGKFVKAAGILGGTMPHLVRAAAAAAAPALRVGKGGKAAPPDIYEAVRELQRLLHMPDDFRTGFFGEKTDAAVRAYQKRSGLVADGIVGPKTWARLRA